MTKENEDALRRADALQSGDIHENAWQSAAHLRRLVAEDESATALVQQMLEALEHGCPPDCENGMTDSGGIYPWGEAVLVPCPTCAAIAAAREWLEGKA